MKNSISNSKFYDRIILSLEKEWKEKMAQDISKPKWERQQYSKAEINRAGSTLADSNSTMQEMDDALKILNNWRAAHAYPLHVITSGLRRGNPNAIVVQRLKRLDSIIGKIKRLPTMRLYRMQDLGGCRVIVDDINEVYSAVSKYKNSRIRHILKREDDYIQHPKESGYRCYHMVYQFQSDKTDTYNKNMLVEIQFRTKLQHIWATAVEMMGIFTQSNLKSSQGNEDILRFFVLVSSMFALRENTPVCPNTSEWADELIDEIRELDEKHNIITTLNGLNVTIYNVVKDSNVYTKNGHYLLILDYEKWETRVSAYNPSELELANEAYNQLEAELKKNRNKRVDVVLVSAKSFDSLKEAYPNYFVDIRRFISIINASFAAIDEIRKEK